MISGFIIAYLHRGDVGTPARLPSFLRKRFLRIYPIYWLVLSVVLPLYFLNHHFIPEQGSSLWNVLGDLTLLPTTHLPDVAVAWTLKHEILFYLVFAVFIFNRQIGLLLASAAVLGSICVLVVGSISPETFFSPEILAANNQALTIQSIPLLFFNPLHLLFLYGAGIVWVLDAGRTRYSALWAAIGLALFFGTGAYECYFGGTRYEMLRSQLYGLGAAISMVGFTGIERTQAIAVPRFLCRLGDASYSLYLIHFALLSALAKVVLIATRFIPIPASLIFFSLFAIAIAAGMLFHHFVETPLLKRLSRRRSLQTLEPAFGIEPKTS